MYSEKFYKVARSIVKKPYNLFFDPIILNKENVPDEPVLFVGNHFSYFDPIELGITLSEREIRFMTKKELFIKGREVINKKQIDYQISGSFKDLFTIPLAYPNALSRELFSYIITKLGAFSIDRSINDIKAVRTAINLLQAGNDIAIFAEGTRNLKRNEQTLLPFQSGIDGIAILANSKIQPFAISRNYCFRSHPIINFGNPFKLEKNTDKLIMIYNDFERIINRSDFTIELEEEVKKLIR